VISGVVTGSIRQKGEFSELVPADEVLLTSGAVWAAIEAPRLFAPIIYDRIGEFSIRLGKISRAEKRSAFRLFGVAAARIGAPT
jgi:hypothetical protein